MSDTDLVDSTSLMDAPAAADAPERLNEDPYGEGWICAIELQDPGELDGLLDAAAYRALVEG